jgi:2,4-dienoyl-CoA reductase-like NADH-dependent reductase (Old Yellow Enzyme family)
MIFTGQVQIDERYLSRAGDVVIGASALEEGPILELWREWAKIAQASGTPACVQIAHPGRMSPAGVSC